MTRDNINEKIEDRQDGIQSALQLLRARELPLPAELEALRHLAPPRGACVEVRLHHPGGRRRIRRDADIQNWDRFNGYASLEYYPSDTDEALDDGTGESENREDPTRKLIALLAELERDPKLHFVSLTWFRDKFLLDQGLAWAHNLDVRRKLIVDAIENKLLLAGKVPNPKSPNFPVTSIRLNRTLPEVREILAELGEDDSDFAPVAIAGGSLSSTILEERR